MTFRILLASTALSLLLGAALPAMSETAAPNTTASYSQAADTYAFPLGDLSIIALSDGTVPQDLHALLTGTSPGKVDEHLDHAFLSNPVEASINAFLIRAGERLTLIDTGSGQLFGLGHGGKLRDSLASIGVMPKDITDILITHIHTDHTGGLVADGKPVFANATVHASGQAKSASRPSRSPICITCSSGTSGAGASGQSVSSASPRPPCFDI